MSVEYLNNKVFEAVIARYRKAEKNKKKNLVEFEQSQLELATAFYTLAKNIIRAFKFQLVDKDDALQEGVMICFEKLYRFDPNIGRAFNFCTTIILNHYRQLYRTAKNYNELKIRYHDHLCEKVDFSGNKGKKARNNQYRRNKDEEHS